MGGRSYGKSDAIDALSVARAALREPNLPQAGLDGQKRELRLLVDHREDLVGERTRAINRLRWHLHELDPALRAQRRPALAVDYKISKSSLPRSRVGKGSVARLALRACRCACIELTASRIVALGREIAVHVETMRAGATFDLRLRKHSPPPRSSARRPALNRSRSPERHTHDTTAPPRFPSPPRSAPTTASAAPVTGSSTRRCTGSHSPNRNGTPLAKELARPPPSATGDIQTRSRIRPQTPPLRRRRPRAQLKGRDRSSTHASRLDRGARDWRLRRRPESLPERRLC